MKPFSPHSNFFSSLKQVEKRLKLEENPSPLQPPPETSFTSSIESLSTPIYLNFDQSIKNTSKPEDSEPPQAFLSSSPQFPQTHQDPSQINRVDHHRPTSEVENDTVDDIRRLMELLGLSDELGDEEKDDLCLKSGNCGDSCNCEGEFYKKIVGIKGPKCVKEVNRLNGWIEHFANDVGEERIEPLRLAHLLLGKANFALDGCGGFEGIEFPSTIEEFLENDPPLA